RSQDLILDYLGAPEGVGAALRVPEQSALSLGLSLSRECPKEPLRPMSEQHCAFVGHLSNTSHLQRGCDVFDRCPAKGQPQRTGTGLAPLSWSSLAPPEGV